MSLCEEHGHIGGRDPDTLDRISSRHYFVPRKHRPGAPDRCGRRRLIRLTEKYGTFGGSSYDGTIFTLDELRVLKNLLKVAGRDCAAGLHSMPLKDALDESHPLLNIHAPPGHTHLGRRTAGAQHSGTGMPDDRALGTMSLMSIYQTTPRHRSAATPQDADAAEQLRARIEAMRDEADVRRAGNTAARAHLLSLLDPDELDHCRITDIDAAAACLCSCHPTPADAEMHGERVCSCQKTEEQRRADQKEALQELQKHSGAMMEAVQAELDALRRVAADLGATIEQAGGSAPYQILGQVDSIRFYLRERHDEWSLQIPDEQAGDLGEPVGTANGVYIIAEGDAAELYDPADPAKPLRVAVDTVRTHLARRSCRHEGARTFCPDCGLRTAEPSAAEQPSRPTDTRP